MIYTCMYKNYNMYILYGIKRYLFIEKNKELSFMHVFHFSVSVYFTHLVLAYMLVLFVVNFW